MQVATEPQYGEGDMIEVILAGSRDKPVVEVREVPLQALYPHVGPLGDDNHLVEEETRFVKHLGEHGMREPYIAPSARK